jgi:predicted DNA-binding transcriptional regulator YafY
MATKTSQPERMINLLALLVQRAQPLTLKQIRQELVNQYPPGDSAARAAFERDKSLLRALGIPMEMVTLGGDSAGEGAYTVDRRHFEIGDLGLNDAERSALQMAIATVRIGASYGDEALWKLGGERALDRPSTSVNIQMDDRQLPALAAGVVEHRTLKFVYKGQQRQVDPYGLLSRGGFWYIVGFDHLRDAQRVFRVDRIEGDITNGEAQSFVRPEGFDLAKAVPTELELLAEGSGDDAIATVLVDASLAQRVKTEFGQGAVVRERSDGAIEFAIPCANLGAFRVWLFAMVDRAEVLGPPRVRQHIISHLNEIAGQN